MDFSGEEDSWSSDSFLNIVNEVELFAETLSNIENRSQSPSLLMKSNVTMKNALNVIPLENSVHSLTKSEFVETDIEERPSSPSLLKPSVTNVYPQCVNTDTKLGMEAPCFSRMCMSPKSNEVKNEFGEIDIEERPNSPSLLKPTVTSMYPLCVNTNTKPGTEVSCSSTICMEIDMLPNQKKVESESVQMDTIVKSGDVVCKIQSYDDMQEDINILSKLAEQQSECDEMYSGRDRKEKSERKAICACERNIIEESCIFEAMETANYVRFPLICGGCVQQEGNQFAHACMGFGWNEIEREHLLNDRMWCSVFEPINFKALYNAYEVKHNNCKDYTIGIFEVGLRNVLERKPTEVQKVLLVKDIFAERKE